MIQFEDQLIAQKFLNMAEDVAAIKTEVINMKTDITDIKDIKKDVDRHEKIVTIGKFLGIPGLTVLHVGLKHFLQKIGL